MSTKVDQAHNDVNLRCLDGDQLLAFTVIPFDGQNWEENVERIR